MTIARACRPPAQESCRRLAGRWWIAQPPPRAGMESPTVLITSPRTWGSELSSALVGKYPHLLSTVLRLSWDAPEVG